MKGAPQYDVASLLWQAGQTCPTNGKADLLEDYMNSFETIIGEPLDRTVFQKPV